MIKLYQYYSWIQYIPKRLLCCLFLSIFCLILLFIKKSIFDEEDSERYQTYVNGTLIRFRESRLAHQLLDGLRGIEIGASAQNPYGLETLNVDYAENADTEFQKEQIRHINEVAKVHMVAPADHLPFTNESVDFVISSHVLEHFYDPIKTIQEWLRVVKKGGYVYMDIPHKERTFDRDRPRTKLAELLERHGKPRPPDLPVTAHVSVWITQDILELCQHFNWPVVAWRDDDDKTNISPKSKGIGFTVVIQKPIK